MPRLDIRVRREIHDLSLMHGLHKENHHEVDPRRVPIAHEVLLALKKAIHVLQLRVELLIEVSDMKHGANGRDDRPHEERRHHFQVVQHHGRQRRQIKARLGEPHELLLADRVVVLIAARDFELPRAVIRVDEVGRDSRSLDDDAPGGRDELGGLAERVRRFELRRRAVLVPPALRPLEEVEIVWDLELF